MSFKNKKGMSMISIFIMVSIISIFAYTLIEMINVQGQMRENTKNTTSIKFVAESALTDVMNFLRLRPDMLKNLSSVEEGAYIYNVSSVYSDYNPSDLIGTFYSLISPGKFKFDDSDTSKEYIVKLSDIYSINYISIFHEEGMGKKLSVSGSLDGLDFDELYVAGEDPDIEITGVEVNIEIPEGKSYMYLKVIYSDVDNKEIDGINVYSNLYENEGELKTDLSDELNKYVYKYKILGNKILITARNIEKKGISSSWNIKSSYSMEATYFIDKGGNIKVFGKKDSETFLEFSADI